MQLKGISAHNKWRKLPLMDRLKPLGVNRGPGKVVVLVQNVELLVSCIPKIPVTE